MAATLMRATLAKEEQKVAKQREMAIRAQARATTDVAAANFKKAQILQDQGTLSLFTMPEGGGLSELAWEYVELRREEEITNLRRCVATAKANAAREKA
jgi:hypothetical protein